MKKEKEPPSLKKKVISPKTIKEKSLDKLNFQKKTEPDTSSSISRKHTLYSAKVLKNDYMKEIIEKGTRDSNAKCKRCNGKSEFYTENIYDHLKTAKHLKNTPHEEHEKLAELIKLFEDSKERKEEKREPKESGDTKLYLEFLGFALAKNLSFSQIFEIGKYFQTLVAQKNTKFFKNFNFDQEEISKCVSNSFGVCLVEELRKDLELNKYSFMIDTSTLSGDNICTLTVKYLKLERDGTQTRTSIYNKIVAIHEMEDTSNAQTFYNIVNEKLFINEAIKNNFIGIAHDHASTFEGVHKGLITLLRREGRYFFDLPDPCHSLNLVVKHSLKLLHKEIIPFITKIHSHFRSPQRKALLSKIQKGLKVKELNLRHYVLTRWLSLGESLERLLEIWDSLKIYMDEYICKEKHKEEPEPEPEENEDNNKETEFKMDVPKMSELLKDRIFHLKVKMLNHIIGKVNASNIILQSHDLRIEKMKMELNICYRRIINFTLKPEQNATKVCDMILLKWNQTKVQEEWFMSVNEFIKSLKCLADEETFKLLEEMSIESKEAFAKPFYKFIAKMLTLLEKYFPFKSSIVKDLDLVTLSGAPNEVVEKFLNFNKYFNVVPEERIANLKDEIEILTAPDIYSFDKTDTLAMWDIIKKEGKFPYSTEIAMTAQSLPTSSAVVEQAFSKMKLLKTDLRNRLSEPVLQGLLYIKQECLEKGKVEVTPAMLDCYEQTKQDLNKRKRGSKNAIQVPSDEEEIKNKSIGIKRKNDERQATQDINSQEHQDELSVVSLGTLKKLKRENEGREEVPGTEKVMITLSKEVKRENSI